MVMVMETPSPKNVGREFVRQYYTMLNNSPLHLHRFYNSNSSFVHGGIDQPGKETKPVYGQQEIHKKIMQLNFRDCHTKIRQVDSHATLGNGVVVQVTGELSNDGQPMRRFMQTFVLVPQSPKRYYVHNDIFRYQDEVFPNEEESDSPEGAPESETEEERVEVPGMPDIIQEHSASAYLDQQTVSNGAAHVEELAAAAPVTAQPSVPLTSQAPHPPVTAQPPTIPEPVIPEIEKLEQVAPPEIPATYEEKPKTPEPPEDIALQHTPQQSSPSENNASPEPKTYANMVSKNATSTPITSSTSNTPTAWHATGPAKSTTPSQATNHHPHQNNQRSESKPDGYQNSQGAQPQRVPRSRGNPVRGGLRDRGPGRGPEETGDGDRRRLQHPDSHQLFVGNLPHNVSEDELRETFSKYGNVVDLRINNKPTAKPGNMGRYPNFGFIVFEDPGAVHRCLSEKLFINHHRLNVEEKKTKPREQRMSGSGDGRIGSGRGMGRGGMGAGRGGGRGGMGGINRSDSRGGGNPGGRGGFGQNPRR